MNDHSDLSRLLDLIQSEQAAAAALRFASFVEDEAGRDAGRTLIAAALAGKGAIEKNGIVDVVDRAFGYNLINGSSDDDDLTGRGRKDLILGRSGDDFIEGGNGNDRAFGNRGDDTIDGGEGNDILRGGLGDDEIRAGGGAHDVANGGFGDDTLVLTGLLSDYTFKDRKDGAIVIRSKDGETKIIAQNIETIADENGNESETGGNVTLQLLHASDLEGNANAVADAPNFATVVDALDDTFATTLIISSGDNFIPSPFSFAAGTADPEIQEELNEVLNRVLSEVTGNTYTNLEADPGRYDIAIMNAIGFDASAIGNHEFDFGQEQLLDIVGAENNGTEDPSDDTWTGALFPYLSANLDIEDESVLKPIVDADGVGLDDQRTGVIAPFNIIEENGERFGVIGATTQLLETISSTRGDPNNPNDDVNVPGDTNDMALLAATLQPIIDAMEAEGINKIILTSHLQQFSLEQELAGLLDGVDIIIAGGSDTRLADETDRLRDGDEADGDYPFLTKDADGDNVAIVSTDGQYSYVGRLVVEFDAGGNLVPGSIDPNVSGAYATDEQGVLDVTGAETLEEAIDNSQKGSWVRDLVDTIETAALETAGENDLGLTSVDLNGERADVRTQETNLGNLTADANIAYAEELTGEDVLVSIKNGGGIRSSIPNDDGAVSQLEIQQALAFNNGLSLITLTPDQLLEVLNHAVAATGPGATPGQFAQVGGLRFSFDPSLAAGERVRDVVLEGVGPGGEDVKIFEDGVATAEAANYPAIRTVTLSFLLEGGDGYPFADFIAADPNFANVEDLIQPLVFDEGEADFAPVGSEQDAFAEYLADNFPTDGNVAYSDADTPPADDFRILNLGVSGVTDIEL